jgi:dinuclear metal center YbgI/SA1388 family protein
MFVRDLIKLLDELAPFALAEPWDNVGLQVGDSGAEVRRLLVTLDADATALAAARRLECQAVLTHHPTFFEPLASVSDQTAAGHIALHAARAGIALIAAHTNLDKARGGLADVLCHAFGLEGCAPLVPAPLEAAKLVGFVPEGDAEVVRSAVFAAGAGRIGDYVDCSFSVAGEGTFLPLEGAHPRTGEVGRREHAAELRFEAVFPRRMRRAVIDAFVGAHPYEEAAYDVYEVYAESLHEGMGRLGYAPLPLTLATLAGELAGHLGLPAVRYAGLPSKRVQRLAVVPGSGGSLVGAAVAAGADVLVTGDVKYHQAAEALHAGLGLVDVPHDVAEETALERWAEDLAVRLAKEGVHVEFERKTAVLWRQASADDQERAADHGVAPVVGDEEHLHLYTDGGARGNPGPAAIGARLVTAEGEVVEEVSDYIGRATNNVAEYQAMIAGLQMAIDHGVAALSVFADSELIVKQLRGEYKVKDAVLRGFHDEAVRLLHELPNVEIKHIPREQNGAADRLVNEALDAALK